MSDETTRLRALLERATQAPWEVTEIRDGRQPEGVEELGVFAPCDVRSYQKPDETWHGALICRGMDGPTRAANAALIVSAVNALPGLLDRVERAERDDALLDSAGRRILNLTAERNAATERAERAEHKHATVLASLTHALARIDALDAEAKDLHDRMTAAEVHATAAEREHREAGESTRAAWRESERREQELRDRLIAAERERDDLAATLETRTAEHALAVARIAALEARLTAARKATEDLPRHLGASWWGQQLRAALVEPTAEVSRARCPACNGRGVRLYGREIEDGCDECEATGYVPAEVSRG